MNTKVPKTVDGYLKRFPRDVRPLLKKMRLAIRRAAPRAKERISYGIPAYGNLVSFAGWKTHIGFYPGAAAIRAFKRELAGYELARGTVQFPFDRPLPLGLVRRIVKFRVRLTLEN